MPDDTTKLPTSYGTANALFRAVAEDEAALKILCVWATSLQEFKSLPPRLPQHPTDAEASNRLRGHMRTLGLIGQEEDEVRLPSNTREALARHVQLATSEVLTATQERHT